MADLICSLKVHKIFLFYRSAREELTSRLNSEINLCLSNIDCLSSSANAKYFDILIFFVQTRCSC